VQQLTKATVAYFHMISRTVTVTKHAGSKFSLAEHQTVGMHPYKGQ
jgi:hypothetical protein